MPEIKIEKYSGGKPNIDSSCRVCKRSTKHAIFSGAQLSGSEPMGYGDYFQWHNEYQIIQCLGCETVAFRQTHENSEDYYPVGPGDYEHAVSVDIFPNPEEGRNPIEDDFILPTNLDRIYTETIKSINNGQSVLTGIGIRAIVETVCKDKQASGKDLYQKINDLVTQGVLTKDGADILHKLRTLGNEAAHEVKPHDKVQLGLALDVIDHLLQGVYILPHYAKTKFK